ncbi:hypothetical protein GB882_12365 [Georgenia ruanii]|uniref:DUF1795 domain-containing protein n=1 Tax=Georgenia ruanii TaxID=348442 RepID=A0A7J9V0H2_9MICO|nr:hypothetical protein [Georgenia ruanii]
MHAADRPSPASKPAARWDPPAIDGYTRSERAPGPGIVQLEDPSDACVLQLTRSPLPALPADRSRDDRAATEDALDVSLQLLEGAEETARRDTTLTTDAGPMAAREIAVTTSVGTQRAELRMALRASAADRALVGLVHICPAGALDEAVWDAWVAGATLRNTTATTF